MINYILCDKIILLMFIGDSMAEIEKKIEELRKQKESKQSKQNDNVTYRF